MDGTLTIDVVRRLDAKRDASVRLCLLQQGNFDGPWPFILDPDYDLDQLPQLAEDWGVSVDVLSQYRLMLDYIDQTAQMALDEELSPSPEQIASRLNISFEVFEPYFVAEVMKIRRALADGEYEESTARSGGAMPWETGEALDDDIAHDAEMFVPPARRNSKPR